MDGAHAESQVLESGATESGVLNHFPEIFLLREFSDTLHQVLIRLPLAGQDLSHGWYDLERVLVVYSGSTEGCCKPGKQIDIATYF